MAFSYDHIEFAYNFGLVLSKDELKKYQEEHKMIEFKAVEDIVNSMLIQVEGRIKKEFAYGAYHASFDFNPYVYCIMKIKEDENNNYYYIRGLVCCIVCSFTYQGILISNQFIVYDYIKDYFNDKNIECITGDKLIYDNKEIYDVIDYFKHVSNIDREIRNRDKEKKDRIKMRRYYTFEELDFYKKINETRNRFNFSPKIDPEDMTLYNYIEKGWCC